MEKKQNMTLTFLKNLEKIILYTESFVYSLLFLFCIQYFFSNYSPAPWEDNAKTYKCIMHVKDGVPPKDGDQTDAKEQVSFQEIFYIVLVIVQFHEKKIDF